MQFLLRPSKCVVVTSIDQVHNESESETDTSVSRVARAAFNCNASRDDVTTLPSFRCIEDRASKVLQHPATVFYNITDIVLSGTQAIIRVLAVRSAVL